MSKTDEIKEQAYAEIMYMFRYLYKDDWSPENMFHGRSRVWIQIFNKLVTQGFINRKKSNRGYKYKWAGRWPQGY